MSHLQQMLHRFSQKQGHLQRGKDARGSAMRSPAKSLSYCLNFTSQFLLSVLSTQFDSPGLSAICYLLLKFFVIMDSYIFKKHSSFKTQSMAAIDHPDHLECSCRWLMGTLRCILDQPGPLHRGFSVSSMLNYY